MIELRNLTKTFGADSTQVRAIQGISLRVERGDIFGMIGLSGAGKSTLVRCINYLEKPTSGQVLFQGVDLASLGRRELLQTRRSMSMIFQGFHLLAQRTALKNVCFPLELAGMPRGQAMEKARGLLELVDLSDKLDAYPAQLSGGQKQRVAIARALATDPQVLLCDEATSALDPETTRSILELLKSINRSMGVTMIVITHEMKVVEQVCNKVAVLADGRVAEAGSVRDVFFSPRSEVARRMIFPSGPVDAMAQNGPVLRLVFDGQSASTPVVSNLTLACRAPVNILGADTKNIDGKAYGQILLQLPDHAQTVAQIEQYLSSQEIYFEEGVLDLERGNG